jgi:rhodanese-related sulfurtransferase/DNA-binding transcriptional ArsR family regulator
MSKNPIKAELYEQFARIGKALSNANRLEILDLLAQCERSVEALSLEANLSLANTSQHLQVLKEARLVKARKEGLQVYYQLADEGVLGLLRQLQYLAQRQLAEVDRTVRLYYESPGELEPVDATELLKRMAEGEVVVLDVRPEVEYQAGHIPTALSIPITELAGRLAELPRDKEVVAYCRGPYCLYAPEAVELLAKEGYKARRLTIGLPDWRAEGLTVATS